MATPQHVVDFISQTDYAMEMPIPMAFPVITLDPEKLAQMQAQQGQCIQILKPEIEQVKVTTTTFSDHAEKWGEPVAQVLTSLFPKESEAEVARALTCAMPDCYED